MSLFVVCCPLFVVFYLLFLVWLLDVGRSLFVFFCGFRCRFVPCVVSCVLFVVYRSLLFDVCRCCFLVCTLLSPCFSSLHGVVCRLSYFLWCLLIVVVVCCLLFVDCRSLSVVRFFCFLYLLFVVCCLWVVFVCLLLLCFVFIRFLFVVGSLLFAVCCLMFCVVVVLVLRRCCRLLCVV